jgi:hypothetical protein
MTSDPKHELPVDADAGGGLDILSREYRFRRLQQLSLKAERRGHLRLAAQLLDQAAKEQRAGEGGGGGPEDCGIVPLTPEQARKEIAEFLVHYEESKGGSEGAEGGRDCRAALGLAIKGSAQAEEERRR